MAERIAGRYQLINRVGAGGMGEVYRTLDRLTGQTVALKRVLVPTNALVFASRTTDATANSLRLSLAREFRALASLGHPNIISVLDYGFASFSASFRAVEPTDDDEQATQQIGFVPATGDYPAYMYGSHPATPEVESRSQPFFTMTYLEGAIPFDQAMYRLPFETQIELITQMLGALSYLHRHGILHRDLKPGNVLITMDDNNEPRLHLVDFGLAEGRGASGSISGTLLYIAPEALESKPLSEATDLYAVGVMLYEVFAGRHPFAGSARLVHDIRTAMPDMSPLRNHPELRHVPLVADIIKRLLVKEPLDRYNDASLVADELRAAVGFPPVQETAAIRESFLQAAKFVGRDAELLTLRRALEDTLDGKGGIWLIGGESGVGKSRLLDEMRIQALVEGVPVLRGQAVAASSGDVNSGGISYQLWRDIARRLALAFAPDSDDAAPLSDTDLRDLAILRSLVPDIEELVGQPIPSIAPIANADAHHYRLAGTLLTALQRLHHPVLLILEDIHWTGESFDVLKAMVSTISRLPVLILASYRDDERPDLPSQLPGTRLLHLNRLNADAIAQLTIGMLGEAGVSSALIELLQRETEGNAFFLVETVRALAEEAGRLSDIGRAELPERVFAGGVVQVIQRRLDRVPIVARPLLKIAAVAGRRIDIAVLSHALHLTDTAHPVSAHNNPSLETLLRACVDAAVLEISDGSWQFAHDKLRETLFDGLATDERIAFHREVALALEAVYPDNSDLAGALAGHWGAVGDTEREHLYSERAGDLAASLGQTRDALRYFQRSLALSPEPNEQRVQALWNVGRVYRLVNSYDQAIIQYHEALALSDQLNLIDWKVRIFAELAYIAQVQGRYDDAGTIVQNTLPLIDHVQSPFSVLRFLSRYGLQLAYERDFDGAEIQLGKALDLAREHGEKVDEMLIMNNLGTVYYYRGEPDKVMEMSNITIAYYRSINDRYYLSDALSNRGVLLWSLGRYTEAIEFLLEALDLDQQISKFSSEIGSLITLGYCYVGLGDDDMAVIYLRSALRKALDAEMLPLALDALAGIASLWVKQGQIERAAEIYGLVLSHPASDVDIEATVKPLVEALRSQMDETTLESALERGKMSSLETAIAEALGS